jgi:hypothetical protein
LTKTLLQWKQPNIKQGLPVEKKTLITTVFVSVLLLSGSAGTHVANLIAQSPEIITIEADGSINPSKAPITKVGNFHKSLYGEM